MPSIVRLSTSRYARPGALVIIAAGLLALLASLVTSATNVTVANAQSESDFTLDGSINEAAYGSFGSITYTQDDGETIPNGLISVVETDEAYWVAFQQSLTAKSNAYCEDDKAHENCYQGFGELEGSDYIGFEWTADQTGTSALSFGVDVISETDGGYTGTVGTGDGDEIEYGDQKGKDNPTLQDAVRGFSSLHYNVNTVGWTNTTNSPNFTPEDDGAGYVYPSIAEVRLDKQGLGLPSGIAAQLAGPIVETHNSPQAPFDDDQPRRFITCVDATAQEVAVGETATVTFEASEDGQPAAGVNVLVFTEGPGEVVSVGGNQGASGQTGQDGRVDAVVEATGEGETRIFGAVDVDGDGTYDGGVDPVTSPPCRMNATGQQPPPGITVEVDKTNDANGDGTFTDDELAPAPGASVDFRAVVRNTSDVNVVINELADEYVMGDPNTGGAVAIDLLAAENCPQLADLVLEPGESATCFFTVNDYAPPSGENQPNTVTTTVHEEDNPDNTASAEDDSNVRSPAPGEISVNVNKTNDADLDGDFNDVEIAPSDGATVEFEVVVTNTSSESAVVIRELTDTWPGGTLDLLETDGCALLADVVLQPGQSERCFFTVEDYADALDDVVNVVRVEVEDREVPGNVASDEDDSTVQAPGVQPTETGRTPPATTSPDASPTSAVRPTAHPRTGMNTMGLGAGGLVLAAFGLAFLLYGERRRRLAEGR